MSINLIAYQEMNKFIRVASGQCSTKQCYRVEHMKKLDYKQNIQPIIYFKTSILKHIRS